jgi:hypothetical protein
VCYCDFFAGHWRNVTTWPLFSESFSQLVEVIEATTDLKAAELIIASDKVGGKATGLVELGVLNRDGYLRLEAFLR